MSKEFKINLLEEMDLLYAKIHKLEDVCEQANIMLNQRDEIEEGLNKRIAELEAENIRLGIEYQRMRLALGDIAINSKRALNESPTDQLTARWRQERQDDKSPNDTQTQAIVYGKDCEACGGDGTLLLVDNYKGQATALVECPYCNGTGYTDGKEREK